MKLQINSTKIQTHSETHWQELATDYDKVMGKDPAMQALYETILAELPPAPCSVLDLGTGTGTLLGLVRTRYPVSHLVGIDPAPAMVEQALKKMEADGNATFILGSAHQIDFPDTSFDAVISNFALHHLTHAEKKDCAKEVFRVLNPGGRFIYGDMHCRRMGTPDDPDWVRDMFELLCDKAHYFLQTAGLKRMLLQIQLIPKFLLADKEIPATVDYWQDCLIATGFLPVKVIVVEPEFLYHRVIVASKPK